jgi:uncharacterized protein (TIGR02594 family)
LDISQGLFIFIPLNSRSTIPSNFDTCSQVMSCYFNSSRSYRYGFQNQEKDDEVKGAGNSVNYKYRMHDPRIGRFFAVDPLIKEYPYYSSYSFSGNIVINMIELEGLEPAPAPKGTIHGTKANAEFISQPGSLYEWSWEPTVENNQNEGHWVMGKCLKIGQSTIPKVTTPFDSPSGNTSENESSKSSSTNAPWMSTAFEENKKGVKEEPLGSNSGPRVDEYLKYAGTTTPNAWCAAFVHWCLGQNGIKGAGAIGNNYKKWGTKLDQPKYGAIAIFNTGHVGFYVKTLPNGNYQIVHGNASDKVRLSDYTKPEEISMFVFPKL